MAQGTRHIRRMASYRYFRLCSFRRRRSTYLVGSFRRTRRRRNTIYCYRRSWKPTSSSASVVICSSRAEGCKGTTLASPNPWNDHFHGERFVQRFQDNLMLDITIQRNYRRVEHRYHLINDAMLTIVYKHRLDSLTTPVPSLTRYD